MIQPSSTAVAEAVVTWNCIAFLLYPRANRNDVDFFGGDLSRGYRMLSFVVGLLVTCRCLLTRDYRIEKDQSGELLFFAQVALESFMVSFLTLLMPYLLECELSNKINIRPGKNLLKWLYWILFLQLVGLIGRVYVDERFWAIKRVGDSLSVMPVLSVAKLHFRIIPGQMKTIHQTLVAIEYGYFISVWFAVVSYGVFGPNDHSFPFRGFRVAGFFLPRIRLFFHGFLLNIVDEVRNKAEAFPSRHDDSPTPSNASGSVSVVDPEEYDDDNKLHSQLLVIPVRKD